MLIYSHINMLEPHIVVSITQFQLLNDLPNRIPPSPFRLIKYQFVEDLFFVKSPMKPSIPKNWRDNLQHILFSMAKTHGFPEVPLKPTCSFPPWWWRQEPPSPRSVSSAAFSSETERETERSSTVRHLGMAGWGGAWRIPFFCGKYFEMSCFAEMSSLNFECRFFF